MMMVYDDVMLMLLMILVELASLDMDSSSDTY